MASSILALRKDLGMMADHPLCYCVTDLGGLVSLDAIDRACLQLATANAVSTLSCHFVPPCLFPRHDKVSEHVLEFVGW
jgi:hypothetical protein